MTRAVAYSQPGGPEVLTDVHVDVGQPGPQDLLVEVRAVSVNPVDVKQRASSDPGGTPRVLGYDAAGVVTARGEQVVGFDVGDEVWYAGTVDRPGSNAALQLVDHHLVAHKPGTLDFAQAAAMPLTFITAWECLFDQLGVGVASDGTLLVVAAAGGVGSAVCQLARQLTGLTVVGTATREESRAWARSMGAHHVIDHHDLVGQVRSVAPAGVQHVFSPHSAGNVEAYAELLTPRGAVVAIDEPEGLDTLPLKAKSQSWHWELMFTRPLQEPSSDHQARILARIARLVDDGVLASTLTTRLGPLNATSLAGAHARVEGGSTVGKVVLEL